MGFDRFSSGDRASAGYGRRDSYGREPARDDWRDSYDRGSSDDRPSSRTSNSGRTPTAGRTPASGRTSASGRAPGAGYDRRGSYGRAPAGHDRRDVRGRQGYGKPPRRRGGLSPKLRLGLILGAAAIALAGLGVGIARTVGDLRASSVERFLDNVYVNGVNLSGQTYEDGVALVAQEKDRRLNTTDGNITAGLYFPPPEGMSCHTSMPSRSQW